MRMKQKFAKPVLPTLILELCGGKVAHSAALQLKQLQLS